MHDTVPDHETSEDLLPPEDPFQPGTSIGPVWVVKERLGKGGMGSVYRCHNRHAPKIVAAIKLLDASFQHHPEARQRFLREAEILSTVEHPNVVKVANVNLDASPPFIEMDFVDGETLEDRLTARGAMGPKQAVAVAGQLFDALRYLHLKRIFHRDVKPANIVMTADGTVKLVDFGLAVQAGGRAITHATTVDFGTVSYCPPEWGSDQVVEPVAWDLYAVAVVTYEMLTGSFAFPTNPELPAAQQIIQIVTAKQRLANLDLGPDFHPALRELLCKLTSRDPAQRLPDAKAALAMLERFDPDWTPRLKVRPATEPPVNRVEHPVSTAPGPWRMRMLGAAGLLLTGLVVGIAVGMLAAALLFLVSW